MGELASGGTRGTKTVAGVEQLDLFDDQHAIVIARDDTGIANLQVVTLPYSPGPSHRQLGLQ